MSVNLYGGNKCIDLKWWTFPGGERNVRIVDPLEIERYKSFTINCKFHGSDDLIDILLLVNACRNIDKDVRLRLQIPYFPFARQDRVMCSGESLALQVAANLIKSCNFSEVEVWDAHSDVLSGMFEAGQLRIIHQSYLAKDQIMFNPEVLIGNCALVSPDAGALKKIYALAKNLDMPVVEASKKRDVKTGEIAATCIDLREVNKYNTLIVVDDICDGGRTFVELGKEIRKVFTGNLVLVVTHGIFSKGIKVFDGLFDSVLYSNDMRKQNV